MSKSDTRQLKGLAILMMLWLHLFSDEETVRQCSYWLTYINGMPLAYSLTRLASCCVPIYIFLGGYGLAATYQTSPAHRLYGGRRALALMANFWLIFLLFVPLGCMVNPSRYPGDALTFMLNITAVGYNYNGAWWFLLPYVLLTLTASFFISRCQHSSRHHDILLVSVLAVVHAGVYLLKTALPLSDTWPVPGVLTLLNYVSMLLLFTLGILAVKYRWLSSEGGWWRRVANRKLAALCLVILCLVKMLLGSSSLLNVPFVLLLIPLLLEVRGKRLEVRGKRKGLAAVLEFLGLHSCNMWLIHYFFYYMFGYLIYQLRYPLLMFLVLTAASLLCSMILRPLFEPIRKKIRNRE